jgi:hypothetical protein
MQRGSVKFAEVDTGQYDSLKFTEAVLHPIPSLPTMNVEFKYRSLAVGRTHMHRHVPSDGTGRHTTFPAFHGSVVCVMPIAAVLL